jgi:hypothetical protein
VRNKGKSVGLNFVMRLWQWNSRMRWKLPQRNEVNSEEEPLILVFWIPRPVYLKTKQYFV